MDKNKATVIIEETFDKAFDKQTFIQFVQNLLNDIDVSENKYREYQGNLIKESFRTHIAQYTRIGKYTDPNGIALDVLAIEVQDDSKLDKARTALRNFVANHLKESDMDYALAAFYSKTDSGRNWRFSFIKLEHHTTVMEGEIRQQTEFTPAKRFSFSVGVDKLCRTAKERLLPIFANNYDNPTIKQIEDAFSVETLTKQFYTELFDWYLWALSDNNGFSVTYPNDIDTETDDRQIEEHLIRLITRLMFIWFLKQKKIGDSSLIPEYIFSSDKLSEILNSFEANSKISGDYYNAILQNLFFATLNRQIKEEDGKCRAFATDQSFQGKSEDYGIKTLFRDAKEGTYFKISHEDVIKLFEKVPFLNGGLFECLDKEQNDNGKVFYYDGFSRVKGRQKRAFVPNHLFFTEKETVLLKKYEYNTSKKQWIDKQKDVAGLLTILKRYNFTIEENTPTDVEVALDPELLGKVFENLLGAFNPETNESARKQSGSFYTPREIVNYMVDESLKAYLKQKVGEDYETKKDETKIALFKCKILDPACGSGAFPMGVLNKIIDILKTIEPEINVYETKLSLIENCIYGVDIQPIAVQIAKLRFFISLICEQTPNNNPAGNYGIVPLPNLESKFVAANTLISLDTEQKGKLNLDDLGLQKMKNNLWNIRNHKNLRASSWHEKKKLRNEDKELCRNIEDYLLKNSIKPNLEKIEQNRLLIQQFETQITELPEEWIDTDDAQTSLFGDEHKNKLFQIDRNKDKRDDLNKRIQLCKKEIEKEDRKATLTGLEAIIHKMVSWDPYDQNTTSPFFDPEWMFGLMPVSASNDPQLSQNSGVFDIVIGNPPYAQLQKNGGELSKLYGPRKDGKKNVPSPYKTFNSMGDLYSLFYERGYHLLKPMGRLCFITSNKWMRAGYGENTRRFFAENTNPELLIDFSGVKIFESATVDTNILMFSNLLHDKKSCFVINN
jgi:hypothetical protein